MHGNVKSSGTIFCETLPQLSKILLFIGEMYEPAMVARTTLFARNYNYRLLICLRSFELVECRRVAVTSNACFSFATSHRLYLWTQSRNLLLIKRSQWLPSSSDSSNTAVFLLLRSYRGACLQANFDPVELSRTTLHLWQD